MTDTTKLRSCLRIVKGSNDPIMSLDGVESLACQAADELDALREAKTTLVSALRDLRDNQNGCPLEKYRESWEKAMATAEALLEKYEVRK